MKTETNVLKIIPIFFGFFIMGFCDLVGVSVTYAREQFQWGETQAGFYLPWFSFGSFSFPYLQL